MGFYEQLPDWAGPAPAASTKIADLKRQTQRTQARLGNIPPGGVTYAQLSPGALSGIHDFVGPLYGAVGGEPGGGPDKALYIRTDDGDGGASTALWQYESGAWVRVGSPAKHGSQHYTGGSDPITPANIGAAAASDVTTSVLGTVVTMTASTTLANTGLTLTLNTTTEVWWFQSRLLVNAPNPTMDCKLNVSVPGSATASWGGVSGANQAAEAGWGASITTAAPLVILNQGNILQAATVNGTVAIALEGIVFSAAASTGTVNLRFAQNVSDPGTLSINAGSFLRATRLVA